MKQKKQYFVMPFVFLALFILWTILVKFVDVRAIGPGGSQVGFAGLNGWFHALTGEHMAIYDLTDLVSLFPLALVGCFGLLGLWQLIKRKSLLKVDWDILALGGFFLLVMGAFLFFEVVVINYRPLLIEGKLEASYPSSTTMLAMSVFPVVMLQFQSRIRNKGLRWAVLIFLAAFMAFMVIGRLISGVHWLTDIIGGALLSTGLVLLYAATVKCLKKE